MKKSRPDLSIVIVTYNNAAVIRNCLRTLSNATSLYTTELFVIDNNSLDGTPKILRAMNSMKHLSFRHVEILYNETNAGYTKGVNQGLERCRGHNVLMLNPDIIFRDNPFQSLFECLEEEGIGVVSPQFLFPNGDIQPSCRRFPKKRDVIFEFFGISRLFSRHAFFNSWRFPDFDHKHSADVSQPQGAFLLARDNVLAETGILDENLPMFFSDVDWCRRVHERGWRIRFCADASIVHLQGASVRQRRAEMIVSSHRSFVTYFAKYDKSFFDRFMTALIYILLLAATPLRLLSTKL